MVIKDVRVLKDMLISAVRYALGRHTYIVSETIEFIKSNSALIDRRILSVLLSDIKFYLENTELTGNAMIDADYRVWQAFYNWLVNYEVIENEVSIVSVWNNELITETAGEIESITVGSII